MKRYIYCMAIFAMILYACNNSSSSAPQATQLSGEMEAGNNKTKHEDKQFQSADTVVATMNNIQHSSNNSDWDKKIIKTAAIQLQLDDYKNFNASIHKSLERFGAYISKEKQLETDYKIENTLTIKVPVAQFEALVNSLQGDGIKIIEKNISSDDVTGEVIDTKARMQAKIAVRDRYIELLKQAKNMNDILQVQNEINGIQEDIEAATGRINYLQHASDYSTINLTCYQFINGGPLADEKPDLLTKLTHAFSIGTSLVVQLLLFLISIWPMILLGLLIWLYIKRPALKKTAKA